MIKYLAYAALGSVFALGSTSYIGAMGDAHGTRNLQLMTYEECVARANRLSTELVVKPNSQLILTCEQVE